MIDHVGLTVKDLEASIRFYREALAPLGFGLCARDPSTAGFGPEGAPLLWLYAGDASGGGTHLAFRASDRRAVARFHAAGVATGGRDHGAPGLRADYGPSYYAAFLLDLDGNNVEAVCLD